MHRAAPTFFFAIRLRRTLLGLLLGWLFAVQTITGGLVLARQLPNQFAAALIGTSLCQPGDSGLPVNDSHPHQDCQLCPHVGAGTAAIAPPAAGFAGAARIGHTALKSPQPAGISNGRPDVRSAPPRGPPRAA